MTKLSFMNEEEEIQHIYDELLGDLQTCPFCQNTIDLDDIKCPVCFVRIKDDEL